jgi:hypothetical protein
MIEREVDRERSRQMGREGGSLLTAHSSQLTVCTRVEVHHCTSLANVEPLLGDQAPHHCTVSTVSTVSTASTVKHSTTALSAWPM